MRNSSLLLIALATALHGENALAHTSEQGFVLLLPTDAYIFSGVTVVVLTILAIALLPGELIRKLFTPLTLIAFRMPQPLIQTLITIASLFSLAVLLTLIAIGFIGTHDPLRNLLPLTIWTVWWIGFVCLHGVFGHLWHFINPWGGLPLTKTSNFSLSGKLASWPGVGLLLLFSAFALADTAPENPVRLATITLIYLLTTVGGVMLFGAATWLSRVDCFSMLLWRFAQVAPIGMHQNKAALGIPGWKLTTGNPADAYASANRTVSGAVFTLTLLATGSFDGLNETFWWLAKLGINPLEFPGRSAVIAPTISGLLLAVLALVASFAVCVAIGCQLANRSVHQNHTPVIFKQAFVELSVAILPIALAYHFAHFLTSFMVNIQYTLAAATDPLQTGRDLLGLGRFYVTTGFFNTQDSVRQIWLTQAAAVVIGHVVSLLLAHRIALKLWREPRGATLSQLPLAIFMVFYTLLGLWLLAAPRGA